MYQIKNFDNRPSFSFDPTSTLQDELNRCVSKYSVLSTLIENKISQLLLQNMVWCLKYISLTFLLFFCPNSKGMLPYRPSKAQAERKRHGRQGYLCSFCSYHLKLCLCTGNSPRFSGKVWTSQNIILDRVKIPKTYLWFCKFTEMDLPPESEQKSEDVNADISTEGMVISL